LVANTEAKDDEEKRIALGGGGGGEAESWMDRFRARRMERRVGLEWWRRAYVPRRNEGLVRLPPTQIDDLPRDLILKQDQEFKVVRSSLRLLRAKFYTRRTRTTLTDKQ
jgi:hypothetical protein